MTKTIKWKPEYCDDSKLQDMATYARCFCQALEHKNNMGDYEFGLGVAANLFTQAADEIENILTNQNDTI